jgi:hypothetical protein
MKDAKQANEMSNFLITYMKTVVDQKKTYKKTVSLSSGNDNHLPCTVNRKPQTVRSKQEAVSPTSGIRAFPPGSHNILPSKSLSHRISTAITSQS